MDSLPKISIVIPAYNEATYIDRLLEALSKQNFKDFEVIISDAQSKDGTEDVVSSFKDQLDIKFIESPPSGPGHARNFGAKVARGEWLLFLDADVDIDDPNFVQKLITKTNEKNWHTSSAQLKIRGWSLLGRLGHSQGYMNLVARTKHPIAQGYCLFTNRKVFEAASGFNEKILYGEDNDYVTRTAKHGFGFVKNTHYYVDPRRYEQEGVRLLFKNIGHEIYRLTHGHSFEKNKSKYEFGKHEARKKN